LIAARLWHDVAPRFTHEPVRFDMAAFLPLRLEFFAVGVGSYGLWRWLSERNQPFELPRSVYALLVPLLLLVARKSPAIALWLGLMFVLIDVHFGKPSTVQRHVSGALNSRLAQFLGRISYPIYLLHLPALVFVRQLIQTRRLATSAPMYEATLLFGGLAATIVGAWLLNRCIEQPMIGLGKRITTEWKLARFPPVDGRAVRVR